ncbi:MAG: GntR family transcriptional regulator [Verrucomicrobia bacterium]|nr:GntR family transcriptional regulator [Verrucomicrobiota bacterium]MBU1733664.1 GntR family transcriptional regulator [Verrucomicrobiota bacterium]MBU1901920.1 GntR family transcriptional regulator [Patescibacteria group bacterium]
MKKRSNGKFSVVKDYLVAAIAANEYAAGEFIPSENKLSKQHHVSRPTIRKALAFLEKEGLISSQPGKGRIVAGRNKLPKPSSELQLGINMSTVVLRGQFYTPSAMAILHECSREGIKLNLIPEEDVKLIDKKGLNGVIWLAPTEDQIKQLAIVAGERFPVVLVSRVSDKLNISYVAMDHQQGACAGVDYLVGCGHRNIAFVGGPCEEYPYRERMHGYCKALRSNNIPFNGELILDIRYSTRIFDQILAFLSKNNFSAVFINGGAFAFPVLNALSALKKRIPDDVSVVCFDDVENDFEHYGPPLTAIRQLVYKMGEEAAKVIIKMIREKNKEWRSIKKILTPEMIVRQSCGKMNAPPLPADKGQEVLQSRVG